MTLKKVIDMPKFELMESDYLTVAPASKIYLKKGDITKEEVDVIVNAAHEKLSGGGGVDGAIHAAAGPQLAGECIYKLYGCPVGSARITNGYNLKASYVIHTVAPVWRGGVHNEFNYLRQCYRSCLDLASLQGLKTISFPCLGTGAFSMPKKESASEALDEIKSYFNDIIRSEEIENICPDGYIFTNGDTSIKVVNIVCFDDVDYEAYLELMPESELEISF